MKRTHIALALAASFGMAAIAGQFSFTQQAQAESHSSKISVPEDFRTAYEFLGAWAVAGDADTGGEVGQHIVYASPGTVKAFRATGKYPDGTVLVKELFKGKTEDLTTGSATSAHSTAGYFVMVKDTNNTHTGPLWGDGWGWAFFSADNTKDTTTKDYKAECLACHVPVRDSDLIYSYAYPVLKK